MINQSWQFFGFYGNNSQTSDTQSFIEIVCIIGILYRSLNVLDININQVKVRKYCWIMDS